MADYGNSSENISEARALSLPEVCRPRDAAASFIFLIISSVLNAVSATLSAVNYNFSATSVQEQSASVFFAVTSGSEGRQLHVFVRDYQPTDFFQGTYAYGDHLVWDMYKEFGYWDLYFVFNEVNE